MARKYGKRFREFEGGWIVVEQSRKVGRLYEVRTTARLAGKAPFEVIFLVSDRSGEDRVFNILIEGLTSSPP